jgi:lipopolysaccharide O-acetyltransferase
MARIVEFARENGWPQAMARVIGGAHRRLRDGITANKVGCPGFRVGRHPRLLGLSHMTLGARFTAGDDLWLEAVTTFAGERFAPELTIGPGCNLSDRVHIACLRKVTIGANFLSGSGVLISDHAHGAYHGESQSSPETAPVQRPLSSAGPVTIGANVWLGDGVMVLAGATIGEGCVVGAGAVVTGEIPARTIAAGAPARVIRRWDEATEQWVKV